MELILTNPLTPGMPAIMRTTHLDPHLLICMLNGFCMTIHFFLIVCLPLTLCLNNNYIRCGTVSGNCLLQKWFNRVIFIFWLASFIAFVRVAQLVMENPEFNWVFHVFMLYIDACVIYLAIPAQKYPIVDEEEGLPEKVQYSDLEAVDEKKGSL